jgi:nitroimidazol reductase NimA-like FMN-containing flavoprotein (pyridoxamine 5'-phosphate oxidase superfamily)
VNDRSTPPSWWEPAYRGGRLEVLERDECRRLLITSNVGRLGYSTGEAQRIVPVNYVVADDHVVFRTSSDTEVARHVPGCSVAFELDSFDSILQAGWSVLVSGTAQELPRESLRAMDVGETPEPWASGVRSLYLRITLDDISGRRVHPV